MKNFSEFRKVEGIFLSEKEENPCLWDQYSTIRLWESIFKFCLDRKSRAICFVCYKLRSPHVSSGQWPLLGAQEGELVCLYTQMCTDGHRPWLNTELASTKQQFCWSHIAPSAWCFPGLRNFEKTQTALKHGSTLIWQHKLGDGTDRSVSRGALLSYAHHSLYRATWKVLLQWER